MANLDKSRVVFVMWSVVFWAKVSSFCYASPTLAYLLLYFRLFGSKLTNVLFFIFWMFLDIGKCYYGGGMTVLMKTGLIKWGYFCTILWHDFYCTNWVKFLRSCKSIEEANDGPDVSQVQFDLFRDFYGLNRGRLYFRDISVGLASLRVSLMRLNVIMLFILVKFDSFWYNYSDGGITCTF